MQQHGHVCWLCMRVSDVWMSCAGIPMLGAAVDTARQPGVRVINKMEPKLTADC
jgi:hypothetical protein